MFNASRDNCHDSPNIAGAYLDVPEAFMFKNKASVFEKGDGVVITGLDDAVKSIASHVVSRLRN